MLYLMKRRASLLSRAVGMKNPILQMTLRMRTRKEKSDEVRITTMNGQFVSTIFTY